MTIDEIFEQVDKVDTKINYWFLRTDYGKFFDEFINTESIGIGWDYLTLNDLRNDSEIDIKKKIAQGEKIDITKFGGKVKLSTIYNKIQTFLSLKLDDVVIIPSRNSDKIAFGRVVDEKAFEDLNKKEFLKRRKVEWYNLKNMDDLNPIFYKVKSNQHTISNVNHYSSHIDRVIGNLFKKGDNIHYVLKIDKTEDINFDELILFMDNIKTLIQKINNEFEFHENIDEIFIKINLQSKGSLELIKKGKSLTVLAYIIFLTSCNSGINEHDDKISKFIQDNKEVLEETSAVIDSLKMNTNELIKPFKKNGN